MSRLSNAHSKRSQYISNSNRIYQISFFATCVTSNITFENKSYCLRSPNNYFTMLENYLQVK